MDHDELATTRDLVDRPIFGLDVEGSGFILLLASGKLTTEVASPGEHLERSKRSVTGFIEFKKVASADPSIL